MQHTIVTATDTGDAVVLKGACTAALLHHVALAWVRGHSPRDSEVTSSVRKTLGTRPRLRQYLFDRTKKGICTIRFTAYKRPEITHYRGAPCGYAFDHESPAALTLREVGEIVPAVFPAKYMPPEEYIAK